MQGSGAQATPKNISCMRKCMQGSGAQATPKNMPLSTSQRFNKVDIAFIGAAGRFPDAKNVNEFWHNLTQAIHLRMHEKHVEVGMTSACT